MFSFFGGVLEKFQQAETWGSIDIRAYVICDTQKITRNRQMILRHIVAMAFFIQLATWETRYILNADDYSCHVHLECVLQSSFGILGDNNKYTMSAAYRRLLLESYNVNMLASIVSGGSAWWLATRRVHYHGQSTFIYTRQLCPTDTVKAYDHFGIMVKSIKSMFLAERWLNLGARG